MDKSKNAEHFARNYGRMIENDKASFSKIANKLLSSSFICESRDSDHNDYYEALKMLSILQDYFSLIDYELIYYGNEKVIQLKSIENYNHYNLKLNESVVLLLLRKLYTLKLREVSLNDNVVVTIEEIHDAIAEIGYLSKRMNKSELREIIRLFKRFSLLDNIGDIEKDDSMLVLYPSIIYAAPYEELTQIDMMIRKYGREEDNETAEQNSAD